MNNFEFCNPAKIIFGKGTENQVGKLVKKCGGSKILLHYGGSSIKKNGLYDSVVKSLKDSGLFFLELGGVQPNPRLSLVRKGIELCKENDIDFILAVGGGSVIDSAKGIAAAMKNEKDIWDYYMFHPDEVIDALPIGVVLTIPAAGSETSDGSVITNEDGNYKRHIGSNCLIPKFAILNPEVTFTLPEYQTACGASDILAHLMERYFTQVSNVDLTDRLIEASIRSILFNAPLALKDPQNYDIRAEIMWAGTLAHNNLLDTGRVGDWASHEIEHELSGIYDIAHGAGLSIVFPAWMKYVYRENIDKFVQFAIRVFDVDYSFDNKERIVIEMINRLEKWYKEMGLPTRLSDAGINDDKLVEMSKKALEGRLSLGNFKKLQSADVHEILKLAL
ncbi:MAG TPA: iron-containing alcohol dehydrogenase [Ruminiclostridium sp.]